MAKTERNYLADNCKMLLIVLVVFGHLLTATGARADSDAWLSVYLVVYSFHMPAFMFLSGLFAKSDANSTGKAVINLTTLYIVMTLLVAGADYIAYGEFDFNLLVPVYSAWYLLALLMMRAVLPALDNIRGIIVILVIISIIAPVSGKLGEFLSLARFVYFLPFFMLGFKCGIGGIGKIREIVRGHWKWVVLIAYICCMIAILYCVQHGYIDYKFLKGRHSYASLGVDIVFVGMLMRLLAIGTACLAIVVLLVFMPEKKNVLTYIGTNSLSVYILQAAIMRLFPEISGVDPFVLGFASLFIALPLSAILAARPLTDALKYPADLAVKYLWLKADAPQKR